MHRREQLKAAATSVVPFPMADISAGRRERFHSHPRPPLGGAAAAAMDRAEGHSGRKHFFDYRFRARRGSYLFSVTGAGAGGAACAAAGCGGGVALISASNPWLRAEVMSERTRSLSRSCQLSIR